VLVDLVVDANVDLDLDLNADVVAVVCLVETTARLRQATWRRSGRGASKNDKRVEVGPRCRRVQEHDSDYDGVYDWVHVQDHDRVQVQVPVHVSRGRER
jgi:hypothetical protein